MVFKNLVGFKFFLLIYVLLMAGCAQKERAGDITLATPSIAQSVVTQSSSIAPKSTNNAATRNVARTNDNTIAGTNLVSAYGDTTSADTISQGTAAGIRLPAAISSPVTAAPLMTSTDNNSTITTSQDENTSNTTQSANTSDTVDTPSSRLVEGSKIPVRSLTLVRTKPDCSSADCPSIKVKRLSFIGRDRFNNFLDQIMASMAEVDASNNAAFRNLGEFAAYFWKISKPGYQVVLEASVKRGDEDLVVVQLDSYIFTGGAHGVSTTQYINWLPQTDKILSLESMLLPKKMAAFEQALKKQHAIWLKTNPQALENPAAYNKLWPFVPSDNAALLPEGLAITYDPYTIAPYSFGRPTILIPYSELVVVLRPELLPRSSIKTDQ
jgi:hypothetical protein